MKTYFTTLFLIYFFLTVLGCGPSAEEKAKYEELERINQSYKSERLHGQLRINLVDFRSGEYMTQEIDSCEYITGWSGGYHGGPFGMHKGNCKFCQTRLDAKLDTVLARFYRKLKHK